MIQNKIKIKNKDLNKNDKINELDRLCVTGVLSKNEDCRFDFKSTDIRCFEPFYLEGKIYKVVKGDFKRNEGIIIGFNKVLNSFLLKSLNDTENIFSCSVHNLEEIQKSNLNCEVDKLEKQLISSLSELKDLKYKLSQLHI